MTKMEKVMQMNSGKEEAHDALKASTKRPYK